jgi:hypothetical protein
MVCKVQSITINGMSTLSVQIFVKARIMADVFTSIKIGYEKGMNEFT